METVPTKQLSELRVVRTYFIRGIAPKTYRFRNAIKNPPTSGYGIAIVLTKGKSNIIFSPFTLESFSVPPGCAELEYAKDLLDLVDVSYLRIAELIKINWESYSELELSKDYGIAAMVLKMLGTEPPIKKTPNERRIAEAKENGRSAGGKPVNPDILKPLKRGTKRAEVAKFFQNSAPIQEVMHELNITRSGVLSHLHCINKYNGFGYELTGDSAKLIVPEGSKLFEEGGG